MGSSNSVDTYRPPKLKPDKKKKDDQLTDKLAYQPTPEALQVLEKSRKAKETALRKKAAQNDVLLTTVMKQLENLNVADKMCEPDTALAETMDITIQVPIKPEIKDPPNAELEHTISNYLLRNCGIKSATVRAWVDKPYFRVYVRADWSK